MRSQLDFSAIRARVQLTSTISRIRHDQTQIAIARSIIATAIAENKIAECRNTYARSREWLVGSDLAPENLEPNSQSLEQKLKSDEIS